MQKNMNPVDRILRLLFGAALLTWAIAFPDTPYSFGGWIGIFFVLTGLAGRCPVYKLFGFSTCNDSATEDQPWELE